MSGRKIDLAAIEAHERVVLRTIHAVEQSGSLTIQQRGQMVDAQDRLALVAAVRAAIRVRDCPWEEAPDASMAFKACLAPFTDSAEVRSDD